MKKRLLLVAIIFLLGGCSADRMIQQRVEKFLGGCKDNLTALGHSLDAYKKDNGKYPDKLKDLVPKYIGAVPECPAAVKDTYTLSYSQNSAGGYVIYCKGDTHRLAGLKEDMPRFQSDKGLVLEKRPPEGSRVSNKFESPNGYSLNYSDVFNKREDRELGLVYSKSAVRDPAATFTVNSSYLEPGQNEADVFDEMQRRLFQGTNDSPAETTYYPADGFNIYTTLWHPSSGEAKWIRLYHVYDMASGLQIRMVGMGMTENENNVFDQVVKTLKLQ
ncbi:MAG: hypothetical protein KC800_29250 [Candidatus Eremiobacteraeota bacterium]|nr:hypothetical protein [Candidatus Eremiobacteraeota bacterium]